ncbi:MAG: hypothetical protein IKP32_04645 [Clostridia bacterium]|nr:hypothetical protein [Clostridia bacterium]
MRKWLERIKDLKAAPWVAVALACALAWALMSLPSRGNSGMTEEEQRVSATLSRIAGAGDTRISIFYAQESSAFGIGSRTPVGAVIVARGAGDVAVRLDLIRAAEALLGLTDGQVEVFPMEDAP